MEKVLEIDILAINKEYAVLIEAKSTLGIEDVNEHIERLKIFKKFFPEYSDRKVIGAVAGIVIPARHRYLLANACLPRSSARRWAWLGQAGAQALAGGEEGADKFAYRQGLFVIGQTGETVKILNDKTFKPRIW